MINPIQVKGALKELQSMEELARSSTQESQEDVLEEVVLNMRVEG